MPTETRAKRAKIVKESNFEIYEFVKRAILSGEYDIAEIKDKINQDNFAIDFHPSQDDPSLLHYACAQGRKDLFDLFVENGADIFQEDLDENTTLYQAVLGRNNDIVRAIIGHISAKLEEGSQSPSAQSYIRQKGKSGWGALQLALAMEEFEIVQYLLDNGANIRDTVLHEDTEFNALHLAAGYGNFRAVKYLAENHRAAFDSLETEESYLFHPLSILCRLEDGQEEEKKSSYENIVNYLITESLDEISEDLISELKDLYPDRIHKIDEVVSSMGVQDELESLMLGLLDGDAASAAEAPSSDPAKAKLVDKVAKNKDLDSLYL